MASVSGLRGIVGASLTPEVITRYSRAFACWMLQQAATNHPALVLGRDGRAGGAAIMQIAGQALAAAGCDVIDLGIAATPTVGLMVRELGAQGGLVVTASHNPGQWNGLKPITQAGAAPAPPQAAALLELWRSGAAPPTAAAGKISRDDSGSTRHVAAVIRALEKLNAAEAIINRRFRVVVDSVNASGGPVARALLEQLGCEVVSINDEQTGIFPHPPEPTAAHLTGLCVAVREARADLGLAQDPDADRLAIIDENGRYIGEEYTLALAALSLLMHTRHPHAAVGRGSGPPLAAPTFAANLSTSRMLDDIAARCGGRVVRSPVGEAHVVAAMRAHDALLGGEGNGGVIWPAVVYIRDSLSAMALGLALAAGKGKAVSELVAQLPAYAMVKHKLAMAPGMAERGITAAAAAFPDAAIDRQDGIRLDWQTAGGPAWLHIRPSNTEPILRLIAEAPTPPAAADIVRQAEQAIKN